MPFYESPSELNVATDIIVTSTTAFRVGRTEAAPAFVVNTNTASSATGFEITAAAAAGGVTLTVVSSGANESGTISAKGTGTLTLNTLVIGSTGIVTTGTWQGTAVAVGFGGTGLASGTSGGVPYFSATTTIASSGLLTAAALVLGGGAGAAPTSLALGTANQVVGMNSGATAHEYKSFAVGTTGTDFAVAHSANTVTFNLPDASATVRGVVTTGTQTFAGAKTFSGAAVFSSTLAANGAITMGDAIDIVLNVTTGTKIGTAVGQKLGLWNAAPIVQPGSAGSALTVFTQTYSTVATTHANLTSADIGAFTGGVTAFLDAAERDNIRTQYNALRADLTNLKGIVNRLIDSLQLIGAEA